MKPAVLALLAALPALAQPKAQYGILAIRYATIPISPSVGWSPAPNPDASSTSP